MGIDDVVEEETSEKKSKDENFLTKFLCAAGTVYAGCMADAVTTYAVLSSGGEEVNPVGKSIMNNYGLESITAIKFAAATIPILTILAAEKFVNEKDKLYYNDTSYGILALYLCAALPFMAAINNVYQML